MIFSTRRVAIASLVLASASLLLIRAAFLRANSSADHAVAVSDYKVAPPITHDNLSIYLILGADRISGKQYLTLAEAMDQKLIKVYETGDVNRLTIENVSKDRDVYVQSGDIVKGGRQDRTIAMDFVCPPGAKQPIDAFCVEHGRWRQRGDETASEFASSNNQISSNALKVAVKGSQSQGEVWRQVDQLQSKASGNVGESVKSMSSESSLQLSLENKKLQETTEQYVKAFASAAETPNAIGFAFAINGQVKSADVYASHDLFVKLWPKLLHATAVEAVADLQKDKTFNAPELAAVKSFIEASEKGKTSDRQVTERVRMTTRDGEKHLLYETKDLAARNTTSAAPAEWIHRNYLLKDDETMAALKAQVPARARPRMNEENQVQQQLEIQRDLQQQIDQTTNRVQQPATQPSR